MEAFLTSHGFNYSNLCNIMMSDPNNRIFITGEAALYVYLTIAGKSLDWIPSYIMFISDIQQLNILRDYIISIGYTMCGFSVCTWSFIKYDSIPIVLRTNRVDKPVLSILGLLWAPDTRFINGDKSAIVDAINMQSICYNLDHKILIALYKRRGFKIFCEL